MLKRSINALGMELGRQVSSAVLATVSPQREKVAFEASRTAIVPLLPSLGITTLLRGGGVTPPPTYLISSRGVAATSFISTLQRTGCGGQAARDIGNAWPN